MLVKLVLAFFLCITATIESANILGIFHFPSKSHHIMGSALLKALAKRGHQVTMLSSFPLKTPMKNYEDIELTGMLEYKEENVIQQFLTLQNASFFEKMSVTMEMVDKINEGFLNHIAVKKLLESNRKFDIVIQCWATNEAFLGLSYYLDASTIVFSTIGSSPITNPITANPAPYSYVPNIMPYFPDEMTFLQRAGNTISYALSDLYYNLFIVPQQEQVLKKYFPNAPPIKDLLSNVSLVLLNSHYSIETPRPYVPSMVQVGGLHVEEPKELKGDLKTFMDSATDGVIFFSLGSNIKSADLPKETLTAITETFAKFPLKVLWKFETDDVPHLPSNVRIGKWLPQRDILAHHNIKLFVSHGGLLSTTEAIYHGVPMVGIPIFGDQERNVDEGVEKGFIVKVAFQELSKLTLSKAINEVLSNPRYKENIKRRSLVLRDQPSTPMENAVFWVEYVLRHKGAAHLKTSALKLQWYQYYLLDVLGFVISIVSIIFYILYLTLWILFKLLKNAFYKQNKIKPINISKKSKKSKQA